MSEWPRGDSRLARLIRNLDGDATPLGEPQDWPVSLKTVVDLMLGSAGIIAAADQVIVDAARDWAKVLDGQRWGESWSQSGAVFRSQITQADWTSRVEPLRRQFGAVALRSIPTVTHRASLPGAPAGECAIVQFATGVANNADAVETVVLARGGAA